MPPQIRKVGDAFNGKLLRFTPKPPVVWIHPKEQSFIAGHREESTAGILHLIPEGRKLVIFEVDGVRSHALTCHAIID